MGILIFEKSLFNCKSICGNNDNKNNYNDNSKY